jgi:excisionase family DNA binding protein
MALPLYMTEHVPTEHTLSIREAAQYLGVGETTIRRRIQNGELRAFKLPTRGGFEWRVYIPLGTG